MKIKLLLISLFLLKTTNPAENQKKFSLKEDPNIEEIKIKQFMAGLDSFEDKDALLTAWNTLNTNSQFRFDLRLLFCIYLDKLNKQNEDMNSWIVKKLSGLRAEHVIKLYQKNEVAQVQYNPSVILEFFNQIKNLEEQGLLITYFQQNNINISNYLDNEYYRVVNCIQNFDVLCDQTFDKKRFILYGIRYFESLDNDADKKAFAKAFLCRYNEYFLNEKLYTEITYKLVQRDDILYLSLIDDYEEFKNAPELFLFFCAVDSFKKSFQSRFRSTSYIGYRKIELKSNEEIFFDDVIKYFYKSAQNMKYSDLKYHESTKIFSFILEDCRIERYLEIANIFLKIFFHYFVKAFQEKNYGFILNICELDIRGNFSEECNKHVSFQELLFEELFVTPCSLDEDVGTFFVELSLIANKMIHESYHHYEIKNIARDLYFRVIISLLSNNNEEEARENIKFIKNHINTNSILEDCKRCIYGVFALNIFFENITKMIGIREELGKNELIKDYAGSYFYLLYFQGLKDNLIISSQLEMKIVTQKKLKKNIVAIINKYAIERNLSDFGRNFFRYGFFAKKNQDPQTIFIKLMTPFIIICNKSPSTRLCIGCFDRLKQIDKQLMLTTGANIIANLDKNNPHMEAAWHVYQYNIIKSIIQSNKYHERLIGKILKRNKNSMSLKELIKSFSLHKTPESPTKTSNENSYRISEVNKIRKLLPSLKDLRYIKY